MNQDFEKLQGLKKKVNLKGEEVKIEIEEVQMLIQKEGRKVHLI